MAGIHYIVEPSEYLEPKIGQSGVAAWKPRTIIEAFQNTVKKLPNHPALCYKRPVNVINNLNN